MSVGGARSLARACAAIPFSPQVWEWLARHIYRIAESILAGGTAGVLRPWPALAPPAHFSSPDLGRLARAQKEAPSKRAWKALI